MSAFFIGLAATAFTAGALAVLVPWAWSEHEDWPLSPGGITLMILGVSIGAGVIAARLFA